MNQLQDLLTNFETVTDRSIKKTWEAKNLPINLEVMASEAKNVSKALVEIGDYCYQELMKNEAELTVNQCYAYNWVCFEWTNLAILCWRDFSVSLCFSFCHGICSQSAATCGRGND